MRFKRKLLLLGSCALGMLIKLKQILRLIILSRLCRYIKRG